MQKLHCLGLFAVPCWDWVEKFARLVKGSWPPMNETCKMACDLFFDEGKEIFYLGEDRNGCTADRSFFDAYSLEQIDVGYRPLFGVYDQMFRVRWKKGEEVEEVREKELEVV